ncbi:non-specific serine,threonine protein kinase [Sarracenia purpurea var. burkii]
MISTAQKKTLHSKLATKLSKLTIPESSSSASDDFDFSDVFGPSASSSSPSSSPSSSALTLGDPEIIHHRSHSFVGPSPRFSRTNSFPFKTIGPTLDSESSEEHEDEDEGENSGIVDEIAVGKRKDSAEVRRIGPGDFEILRVIGKGAFGKVFQVRMKDMDGIGCGDDGIFAMKVMRKEIIIKNNHVDYMKAERDILTKVVHPFIVQLRYSFQTKSKLYLIFDFINGGHLFFHLYRQGIFSEDQARIYTAEIVSAVSHLHKCGIVHRDLKPENTLMDADGHIVLTDFGLAKEINESSRSNSMCGTTEYMAPEILLGKGHNKDADWWSVGILLYEMLTGQPPFTHANRKKLQERIINEKVKLPPRLTSEAHSLLKGLLQKEPSRRLGSGPRGADEIKSHKWFRPINWKRLESRDLLPKFKPDVSGKDCTTNFDKCWTAMSPVDSPAPTPTMGEHFQGYTYVAPNPWLSST